MIKAVIFDMDGVLIDSEPFWKEAEISVFSSVGVTLSAEMCETTTGMRLKDVVTLWHSKYPWDTKTRPIQAVENEIIDSLIMLIDEKGELSPGVNEAIELLKSMSLPMAIASSSNMRIINSVVDKFDLRKYFSVIYSAEFESAGKPDPAIYISTARQLKVNPEECIAIEDSLNGLKSAKKAGMKTLVIPDPKNYEHTGFEIADLKLRTLQEFTEVVFNSLNKNN